jgi:hypothetical protein
MDDRSRKDIRRVLKTFGIKADEAMIAHLARNPDVGALRVRISLEDITDYADQVPDGELSFSVEDEISRQ